MLCSFKQLKNFKQFKKPNSFALRARQESSKHNIKQSSSVIVFRGEGGNHSVEGSGVHLERPGREGGGSVVTPPGPRGEVR